MIQRQRPITDGSRRHTFLTTLGTSLAAPALLRPSSRKKRYPISFSTLGCPAWSLKTILDQADHHGYAAIELTGTRLAGAKQDLAALGIAVCGLGASSCMHEKGRFTRAARRSFSPPRSRRAPVRATSHSGRSKPA